MKRTLFLFLICCSYTIFGSNSGSTTEKKFRDLFSNNQLKTLWAACLRSSNHQFAGSTDQSTSIVVTTKKAQRKKFDPTRATRPSRFAQLGKSALSGPKIVWSNEKESE